MFFTLALCGHMSSSLRLMRCEAACTGRFFLTGIINRGHALVFYLPHKKKGCLPACTHTHTHMHGYYPLSRDWQAAVKSGTSFMCVRVCVCVCVCLCVCWCNGQHIQADGRLEDGRLVHTGFPALPLMFSPSSISPQRLASRLCLFHTPHVSPRNHLLSLRSVKRGASVAPATPHTSSTSAFVSSRG